jgi:hypothetical protein
MTISWLNGSNAFLDGARPIDVLRVRGFEVLHLAGASGSVGFGVRRR